MISKRRDCRLMMCTTMLHGGVCYRTSTPHKIGNKMKEGKKKEKEMKHTVCLMSYLKIIRNAYSFDKNRLTNA